jgi:hypothetical protein
VVAAEAAAAVVEVVTYLLGIRLQDKEAVAAAVEAVTYLCCSSLQR